MAFVESFEVAPLQVPEIAADTTTSIAPEGYDSSCLQDVNHRVSRSLRQHPLFKVGSVIAAIVASGSLFAYRYQTLGSSGSFDGPQLNVDVLPANLPLAVQDEVKYAGQVIFASGPDFLQGSTVQISDRQVLTAGHVIRNSSDRPRPGISNCQNIEVYSKVFGSQPVNQAAGSFEGVDEGSIPDIGLLQTASKQVDVDVSIAKTAPKPGQPLFFVNYEPYPNGTTSRDPAIKIDQNITYPAEYGGVFERRQSNGDYDIVTGLKSYGNVNQATSIEGSSGGPVYNLHGQLVGIVVMSSVQTMSPPVYDWFNNVDIQGAPSSASLQMTQVQPANALIPKISKEIESSDLCKQN